MSRAQACGARSAAASSGNSDSASRSSDQPSAAALLRRSILWIVTPSLYSNALVECLRRYLLAQRVVLPGMLITVLSTCACPLYNYVLIYR